LEYGLIPRLRSKERVEEKQRNEELRVGWANGRQSKSNGISERKRYGLK
jgi:hypothetical protein